MHNDDQCMLQFVLQIQPCLLHLVQKPVQKQSRTALQRGKHSQLLRQSCLVALQHSAFWFAVQANGEELRLQLHQILAHAVLLLAVLFGKQAITT